MGKTTKVSKLVLNQIHTDALAAIEATWSLDKGTGHAVDPKWWARDKTNPERLYFGCGRKDAKVYIGFSNPVILADPELRIWIEPCGQHPNWYRTQESKLRDWYWAAFSAVRKLSVERNAVPGLPQPSFRDGAEDAEVTSVA